MVRTTALAVVIVMAFVAVTIYGLTAVSGGPRTAPSITRVSADCPINWWAEGKHKCLPIKLSD